MWSRSPKLGLSPQAPSPDWTEGLISSQKKGMWAQTPGVFLGQGLQRLGEGRSEVKTEKNGN